MVRKYAALCSALSLIFCGACQRPSVSRPPADALSYTIGPDSAHVQVVEMADFACPACSSLESRFVQPILRTLAREGKIRFTFQVFPLAPIHPRALDAAAAAACASKQGQFWAYHDSLYAHQDDWARDDSVSAGGYFVGLGAAIGLDKSGFESCVRSGEMRPSADSAWVRGAREGFRATPTFLVDGESLPPGSGNAVVQALEAHGVELKEFLGPTK